jgi:hypothetical protein
MIRQLSLILLLALLVSSLHASQAVQTRSELIMQKIYYITTFGLNVRSDDRTGNNILGSLEKNDEVKVVYSSPTQNGNYVEVEVIKSENDILQSPSGRYFVSFKYLTPNRVDYKNFTGEYFMIQNIATEKMRVYRKNCNANRCNHKMVLEANMAAGEDEDGVRTNVGSYRITYWWKFYEDGKQHYPSWYAPGYPKIPKPGKGFLSWFKKRRMPKVDGKKIGVMRGAFGWYTAYVGPNPDYQWTHGTIGWGSDKDKFILKTKKYWANVFVDPRSSGCSRTDNESIAYIRHILPVGTPIIKIYAHEDLLDSSLSRYSEHKPTWSYILTKKGAQTNGPDADRQSVLARGVRSSEIIEEGTYSIDQMPTPVEYTMKEEFRRKLGDSGNVYGVAPSDMHGVFYIDAGLVRGYRHPTDARIKRGGYRNELVLPIIEYK